MTSSSVPIAEAADEERESVLEIAIQSSSMLVLIMPAMYAPPDAGQFDDVNSLKVAGY
jgi:hypothetical protein